MTRKKKWDPADDFKGENLLDKFKDAQVSPSPTPRSFDPQPYIGEDLTGLAHNEKCVELLTGLERDPSWQEGDFIWLVHPGAGDIQDWVRHQGLKPYSFHQWFQDKEQAQLYAPEGEQDTESSYHLPDLWQKQAPENIPHPKGAILRQPRTTAELLAWVAVFSQYAPEEGMPIWIYGQNDEGIKGALAKVAREFSDGHVEVVSVGKKSRIGSIWIDDASKSKTAADLSQYQQTWNFQWPGSGDKKGQIGESVLPKWPGIFASGEIDQGTRLLLEVLSSNKWRFDDRIVVDMGCGGAVVSAWLKASRGAKPKKLMACDAHHLSTLAYKTAFPEALTTWDFMGGELPASKAHFILTNPPFHQGKKTVSLIGPRWLEACHRLLRTGGQVILVHNRHLDYIAHAIPIFGKAEVLAQNASFQVISLVK